MELFLNFVDNYFDLYFSLILSGNVIIFLLSVGGLLGMRRSLILIFICVELILLCGFLNFSMVGNYLDDLFGMVFSLYILGLAAGESAIGLALLVVNYRHKAV